MTVFDDIFLSAAWPAQSALLGETIVYRPAVGSPRTVTGAIVNRSPEAMLPQSDQIAVPRIEIEVPNDVSIGIAYEELDVGLDQIDVSIIDGGPVTTRNIAGRLGGAYGVTSFYVH